RGRWNGLRVRWSSDRAPASPRRPDRGPRTGFWPSGRRRRGSSRAPPESRVPRRSRLDHRLAHGSDLLRLQRPIGGAQPHAAGESLPTRRQVAAAELVEHLDALDQLSPTLPDDVGERSRRQFSIHLERQIEVGGRIGAYRAELRFLPGGQQRLHVELSDGYPPLDVEGPGGIGVELADPPYESAIARETGHAGRVEPGGGVLVELEP